jgi:alginate O-acetyltransferase complex protein AlgI
MLFNSIHFVFFFIVVTTIYFALAHKFRWIWLLAASCYFYMAFIPIYILILGGTIVIDYFAGIWIENAQGKKRKAFLILSLIANIGVLAVFKYYNFFIDNINSIINPIGLENKLPYLAIILPIGLSFHTFQAMSYTIEVYRGNQKAERHFGIYALYVMFYPQLVAGPIERPQNLLHQFYEKHEFDYSRIVEGLKLILMGLFMKLVVADRLALYVDAVYNNPSHHEGKTFALATLFFTIQIYCDFAGYSNIAIGAAKVMGFKLMTNFNRPYFSTSISEFWSRWHISLSTWFKDYVYISLGGNKVSIPKWYFNLFIVFLLSGFWHGANWTFIAWGALNGFYLIFALATKSVREKTNSLIGLNSNKLFSQIIKTGITFVLIGISWVFFRANTIEDALLILKKMFQFNGSLFYENPSGLIYSFFGLLFLFVVEFKTEFLPHTLSLFQNQSWLVRNLSYASLVILILLFGVFDGGQFIYFQF